MSEHLKNISEQGAAEVVSGTAASPVVHDDAAAELHALSAEIVSLLYEQAFAAGGVRTEQQICESFAEILLRHWDLCCIAT